MIGVHVDGSQAFSVPLEKRWVRVLADLGFTQRTVAVGAPILSTVAIVSAHEAAQVNRAYRLATEDDARRLEIDPSRSDLNKQIYASHVACALRVDEILDRIGHVAHYSPWVIVEGADVD